MRVFRVVLAAWMLVVSAGCAAPAVVAPRAAAAEVQLDDTTVFVEFIGDDGEPLGVFLPSALWAKEAEPFMGDTVLAGRNWQRGPRPGTRRPPPLLTPRPGPDSLRYWARRTADPRVLEQARLLYFQRLAEAKAMYPNASGYQNHHAIPRYLGGPAKGTIYRLETAYHQAITQEFRRQWPYGQEEARPNAKQLLDIMTHVYGKYPIPQLIGIKP